MLTLPSALQAHIAQTVTTLAVCWRLERTDGELVLGTEFDRDVVITTGPLAGEYLTQVGITGSNVRSTSDMSVDNMEVDGAIRPNGDLVVNDLSAAEIEAGLYDDATVSLFLCNWQAPDDGQVILRTGNIGAVSRDSDGRYKTELRGLAQRLAQNFVRTYGSSCDAELGDTRCGVDIEALTFTGTVTAVSSTRLFSVSIDYGSPDPGLDEDFFDGGLLTWLTGDNADFEMEVRRLTYESPDTNVQLYLPMSQDITVGDTFTVRPGCDKSAAMCKGRFANLVNFRGHGAWCPGLGELGMFGGQTAERKLTSDDFLKWPR